MQLKFKAMAHAPRTLILSRTKTRNGDKDEDEDKGEDKDTILSLRDHGSISLLSTQSTRRSTTSLEAIYVGAISGTNQSPMRMGVLPDAGHVRTPWSGPKVGHRMCADQHGRMQSEPTRASGAATVWRSLGRRARVGERCRKWATL